MTLLNFKNPGWVGSLVPGVPPTGPFDSLYESFNPLTTINLTHYIELFSGQALDSIWTANNVVGTNTFAMIDADTNGGEGFGIATSTALGDNGTINFNDIRHYDPASANGCVSLSTMRTLSTTLAIVISGFTESNTVGSTIESIVAGINTEASGTDFVLSSSDGVAASATAASFSLDTNFHIFQVAVESGTSSLEMDGILEVTKTTNLPITNLQPIFSVSTRTTATRTGRIRYMEAFNR